jgi:hypothetical protein
MAAMIVKMNPYVIVTIFTSAAYLFNMVKCSSLLTKLNAKGEPAYWPCSNKEKYRTIKRLSNETKDLEVRSFARNYLLYANLSHYTIYIAVSSYIVLALLGA